MELLSFYYYLLIIILLSISEYLPLLFLRKKSRNTNPNYPSISIIIPVKNEEKIISKAISSWLAIDYPGEKEILICDQYSTDNTRTLIENLIKDNQQVKHLLIESPNKLSTMLKGLKQAKNNYIIISDADRFPDKDAVKKLIPFMTDDIGAVFGMPHVLDNNKPFQKITTLEYLNGMLDMLFYSNVDSVPYLFLHTAVIKKSLVDNLEPQNLIADDLYLAINIRKQNYKAIFVPEVDAGEEHVIDFSDLLKRRLRTSQGTIEIAKSNYLGTVFNPKYGLFGSFLMPFRQITMTATNLLVVFFVLFQFISIILGWISLNMLLIEILAVYFILLTAQIIKYYIFESLFTKTAERTSVWAIFAYPIYFLLIRKFLSGYTFLTVLLGKKYTWQKITTDRST